MFQGSLALIILESRRATFGCPIDNFQTSGTIQKDLSTVGAPRPLPGALGGPWPMGHQGDPLVLRLGAWSPTVHQGLPPEGPPWIPQGFPWIPWPSEVPYHFPSQCPPGVAGGPPWVPRGVAKSNNPVAILLCGGRLNMLIIIFRCFLSLRDVLFCRSRFNGL